MRDFKFIFDNNPDAILLHNREKIIDCNPSAINLFSCPDKSMLLGENLSYLCPDYQPSGESTLSYLQRMVEEAFAHQHYRFELLCQKINGSNFYSDVSCLQSSNGNDHQIIYTFIRDISCYKLTGKLIKENQYAIAEEEAGAFTPENRVGLMEGLDYKLPANLAGHEWKAILNAVPDVIMIFDRSFRHLYVNDEVEAMTGIPPEEFIGKTHHELGFPDDLIKRFDKALAKVFSTRCHHRIEFLLPSGVHIDWFLSPLADNDKNVFAVVSIARDVTKLKEVEKRLRKSQNDLLDAMTVARMAPWEIDSDNNLQLNAQLSNILGINKERAINSVKYRDFLEQFVHPDDLPHMLDAFEKVHKTKFKGQEIKQSREYRVIDKKGEVRFIKDHVKAIKNIGDEIEQYGILQDITPLRKVERKLRDYQLNLEKLIKERTAALKASRQRLTDALKLANLGTWQFSINSHYFLGEGEIYEDFPGMEKVEGGYAIEVDKYIAMIHPDDTSIFYDAYERSIKATDEDYLDHIEYRLIKPDGKFIKVYLSIKVVLNDKKQVIKLYGTIQDVTDITKTKSEKELLTAIIEATPDIVAIVDPDGNIIYLNSSGREFYGFSDIFDIKRLNIDDFDKQEAIDLIKNTGFPKAKKYGLWRGESFFIDRYNQKAYVSIVIVSHKNSQGKVDHFSTIIRNVSKQKQIERDLIYKNKELDTFVYRASHDLRGPIASLLGLHQIITHEIKSPEALNYFNMIHQQVSRLNDILITLIDLTHIKNEPGEEQIIDFEEVVTDCIESLKGLPAFPKTEFKINIDVKKTFLSDKFLITTIIQNLLANAIEYSLMEKDSFVKIDISNNRKGKLVIEVTDNGIGIPEKIQDKIFDMFFRGNEKSKGSGLGLYMLKNAVEKLRGNIVFRSKLEKGTTFKIDLPFV